jgi:hypothetical protein
MNVQDSTFNPTVGSTNGIMKVFPSEDLQARDPMVFTAQCSVSLLITNGMCVATVPSLPLVWFLGGNATAKAMVKVGFSSTPDNELIDLGEIEVV